MAGMGREQASGGWATNVAQPEIGISAINFELRCASMLNRIIKLFAATSRDTWKSSW
jgi:hypothetical protein